VLRKADTIDAAIARHGLANGRLLNVGSKDVRLGRECINFDIAAGPGVDVVGDAHELASHFPVESFDAVVLSAVLQYCERPREVLEQAHEVLKPSGLLLIDAPFLQPYCPDGADLWRFTADGLRRLCENHYEILELNPSITAGPALAFFSQAIAGARDNRPAAMLFGWITSLLVYPLRYLPNRSVRTAGAFLLIGRKIG
jgi:SAM-dependent methyltransferase